MGRRVLYFPGCALKQQARALGEAAAEALGILGWELVELPRWNCCGTVYSLASDDLMRHLGPVRNLIRTQELGEKRLVVICSMCYNTLRRSAHFVSEDPERIERINAFMDEEPDYRGEVEVIHLLQFLRDEITFETIEGKIKHPLRGLRVAAYYGCMLLRPRVVGIDDPDAPRIMEDLFLALGAEPVESPYKVECCGAYQVALREELIQERSGEILRAAHRRGAELVVTSCPLCAHNLERARHMDPRGTVPVAYFTQLLAFALGGEGALSLADPTLASILTAKERGG